jgi:hypothetical protein
MNNQLYKTPSSCRNNENFYKRQMFITVSYNLYNWIEEYFNRLRDSVKLAERKMSMAEFIEYTSKKEEENDIEETMLEEGDEEKRMNKIPKSFYKLEDHHFLLFVTYEKFSSMLQETYNIDAQKRTI